MKGATQMDMPTPPDGSAPWTIATIAGSAVAALIWLHKHVVSVVLPGMAKDFENSRAAERVAHLASLKDQHDKSMQAISDTLTKFSEEMKATRENCKEEQDRLVRIMQGKISQ